MSSITNGSNGDGDTETGPDARPKTNHNLSIVYLDHNPDKPIAESIHDEAGKSTDRPNLAVVYIDHHLDGSVPSDTSQGSDGSNLFAAQGAITQNQQGLFRLPPELRIMIWELLLPEKRILRARACYGRDRASDLDDGSSKKINGCEGQWYFRVYDWEFDDDDGSYLTLETPSILTICKESRSVALRHGSFIFGRHDDSHETGTWWNPKLDVLGFDQSWDLEQHLWALQHLQGLEHVKNVAIDERQAWSFCYRAGYNGKDPLDIPRKLREPLAVTFEFRGTYDREHYILDFFPHFQQLGIYFSTIYMGHFRKWFRRNVGISSTKYFNLSEDAFSVTFRLGSDIQSAVKELRNYRKLCMKTSVKERYDDLAYYTLTDGPVYSVKDDDLDIDDLDHWMGAGFRMCQDDVEVPI